MMPSSTCKSAVVVCTLLAFGLFACKEAKEPPRLSHDTHEGLTLVDSFPLTIREPSGLSLSMDGKSLWTVSDDDGRVYEIDVQGKVLRSFQSGHDDLEGIAAIDVKLSHSSPSARGRSSSHVMMEVSFVGERSKLKDQRTEAPEALTFDADSKTFYLMQEKPGILIALDFELREIARRELTLAKDYSGMFYEPRRQQFWILSDDSETLHVLDTNFQEQRKFSASIEQMEGIAVDHEKRLVYVVSDPLAKLFIFRLEDS